MSANIVEQPIGSDIAEQLRSVPFESLLDLHEEAEGYLARLERKAAPARQHADDVRNEIVRRMDEEGATFRKSGQYVARFEVTPGKALVRTDMLTSEPALLEELRAVVPAKILDKAIWVEHVPATTNIRTHLTYLKRIADCGPVAKAIFDRIVDRGTPRRKLVIEREQTAVTPLHENVA